jgi:hypothetical protein
MEVCGSYSSKIADLQTSWRQDNLAFEKEKKDRLVAKNEKIQEEKRARLIRRNEKKEMVANSKARDAIQEESAEVQSSTYHTRGWCFSSDNTDCRHLLLCRRVL